MYLHDSILWAVAVVKPEGISGLNIFCESDKREEIAKFFEETFEKYWSEAEDAVEDVYGNCSEKEDECDTPAMVKVNETGVRVLFEPLYLSYNYGNHIEWDGYAEKALKKALETLMEKYPEVSYEGYIGFSWSDTNGGDVTQYELSSEGSVQDEDEKVYDFVGTGLASVMQDSEFWDEMSEQLDCDADIDDFQQILKSFHAYSKWLSEDTIEKLLDLADEIDEDIRPELEDMLEHWEDGEDIMEDEE